MEQRRLRLGDILDDYCPRERRVTNHAIVAMIEEKVKQTRCTTCDAEHAYKGARVPKRRKKDAPIAAIAPAIAAAASLPLPDGLLSDVNALPRIDHNPPADATTPQASVEDLQPAMHTDDNDNDDTRPAMEHVGAPEREPEYSERDAREDAAAPVADGPVHRPLIRATLPRPEGQKDTRPVPEFTVRHAPTRGSGHGNFRNDRERMRMRASNGNGHGANGNRAQNGGSRFHGNRGSAHRSGAPSGFRSGNGGSGGKRGRGPRG
jgi:hypothetical protein